MIGAPRIASGIRVACLAIALLAAPLVHSQEAGEESCRNLRSDLEQINRQLPSRVDRFTTFQSGSAFYLHGMCSVTYTYSVDSDEVVSFMAQKMEDQGQEVQRSTVVEYLNSEEGDSLMQDIQERMVDDHAKGSLRGASNVVLTIVYTAPDPLDGWESTFYLNDL